jgi:hypothetical protein
MALRHLDAARRRGDNAAAERAAAAGRDRCAQFVSTAFSFDKLAWHTFAMKASGFIRPREH